MTREQFDDLARLFITGWQEWRATGGASEVGPHIVEVANGEPETEQGTWLVSATRIAGPIYRPVTPELITGEPTP